MVGRRVFQITLLLGLEVCVLAWIIFDFKHPAGTRKLISDVFFADSTIMIIDNVNAVNVPVCSTPGLSTSVQTPLSVNSTLFLTISKYSGRLGNRMFQYASLTGIAHANGRKLIIAPDDKYLQATFKLQRAIVNSTKQKFQRMAEVHKISYQKKFKQLPLQNLRIFGMMMSFKYFQLIEEVIREEFTFLDTVANQAATILDNIRIKYMGSLMVGVHVRRSDFLTPENQEAGYGVPERFYFLKAFDWFRSKFPSRNMTFVVASDDLPWCKSNLTGNDVVVVPPASMSVHMAVIAGCDHAIISGGTFSWWCGWLAGGFVIFFNGFMPENTHLGNITTNEDYYPPLWIGMGN